MMLIKSIVPTQTKMSVSTKRITVFPCAPEVTSSSAAEQTAAKNTVTSSGTHAGMAGTLSVASWTDRNMPPNIKPNAADQKQYVPVSSQAAPVPEQQYACADERQKRRKLAERSKKLPEAALLSGVEKA